MNMTYVMESEIYSQPEILDNLVKTYIKNYCVMIDIPIDVSRISIIASGSSYNAGCFAKCFFQNISGVETSVNYASEIANSDFVNFDKNTLYIFISQSGKSSDVVNSFNKVKPCGAKTISITNNRESVLHNEADFAFDINAGREYAVAATKTFSASVLMLWILAVKIAQNKHIDVSEEVKNIYMLKEDIEHSVKDLDNIDSAVKLLSGLKDFSIAGLGEYYPLAREASLKIKETCYINTGSYPMGEFVHGHFALLNKSKVFLTFIVHDAKQNELDLLNKILTTYKTKSIVVSDLYEDYNCDMLIKFNKTNSKIATILSLIMIIQILAFKMAVRLKRNVDKPNGLNKIVEDKRV